MLSVAKIMTSIKYKKKTSSSSLSLFHLNTGFLNKTFVDLEYLNKTTNQTFDITTISKLRILKNQKISKILVFQVILLNIQGPASI